MSDDGHDISPLEAQHLHGQEGEGPDVSAGEASDELNDSNDPNQLGDALAAHHMDKHNQGGVTTQFTSAVKNSARWVGHNGLDYLWLTTTSAGIGIVLTELAHRAEILNLTPTQRGITYGLGLLASYKTVKIGRYAGNCAAILGSALSDGISRTPLVKDFNFFKKRFGVNKRYTDLQKRELGTLKGRVAASALIALTMPAWPWAGKQAGWAIMNAPDAASNVYNFVGNGVDGNRADTEQDNRGAQGSPRIFTPEQYDEPYLPLTPDGPDEIIVLDQAGNAVTLKVIYEENASGEEKDEATHFSPANDVEPALDEAFLPAPQ